MEERAEEVATPRLVTLPLKTGVTFKREYLDEMQMASLHGECEFIAFMLGSAFMHNALHSRAALNRTASRKISSPGRFPG